MFSVIGLPGIRGFASGAVLFAAAAVIVAAPYGCSKGEAPGPAAKAQTEAAAPAQDAPQAATEARSPSKSDLDAAQEQFNLGVQASLKGDYESAIKAYEKTIELDPNSAEAYNNMGFAYYDKGDLDKAIELQRKGLEINPNLPNSYYGLALALEKKGDFKGALENWRAFIKFAEPHSKWWIKAQERITAFEKGEEAAPAPGAGGK